jgi:tryptophan synthase alpha chain
MSAIDDLFCRLRAEGRKAFMPFLTAGYPDLEFTADVIRTLDQHGCSMCELGIPYSDPIADGPVIQASYTRALEQGVKLAQIFEMLRGLTPELSMPIVTMLSYAIVFRHGLEAYVRDAKAAGVSGAIIPDLPVDESAVLAEICRREDFSLIQLVTPTTPRDRAVRIAENSSGFLYYVSVTGITGERTELPQDVLDNVRWLKSQTDLPICIGFGISRPEHARRLAPVADGVIVGSAMVRRISAADEQPRAEVLADLAAFAEELLEAAQSHHH